MSSSNAQTHVGASWSRKLIQRLSFEKSVIRLITPITLPAATAYFTDFNDSNLQDERSKYFVILLRCLTNLDVPKQLPLFELNKTVFYLIKNKISVIQCST